jgi:hypothetical protein
MNSFAPVSQRRYVSVTDSANGQEIARIENGYKVAICGAPIKGWFHISFSDPNDVDHELTGWVRAEFVH